MDRLRTVPDKRSSSTMAKAPHFFKIIFPSIIEDGRLRIPRAFTRKFLDEISSDVAVLTVPTGKTWKVQLKKEKDEIWFQKGLHEFLKYYSVSVGHLLIFKYEGNSHFFVLIFDMSATEIVYPSGFSDLKKAKLATRSSRPKQITRKNKAVAAVANKGRKYLNLATESLEPERKARKSKVIGEFAKKSRGKESSKYKGNARKLDCGSKRSGENKKGSRDFGSNGLKELRCDKRSVTEDNEEDDSVEISDVFPCHKKVAQKNMIAQKHQKGSRDFGSNGLKELHRDKRSVTEDNEEDDSVEILDVFPCHKKAAQKNMIDERGGELDCLQNQCDNNRHSLRLVANRSKGKVDFSSRLCELRDDYVVYANGVKFKLPQMKKLRVEEMEQARELVDKSKRSLTKRKGNEEVVFVSDDPSENNILEDQNCGKKSNSEENQSVEILGVSPIPKKINPRNKVIASNGTVCGPQSYQCRYSPRIAANRAKEIVGVGPRFYELRNRSVLCSNCITTDCIDLSKRKKVQVKDAGKASKVVDENKRSLKHEGTEELGLISRNYSESYVSDSNCSRSAGGGIDHPSKKLRGSEDLTPSVHFTGLTRALTTASETDILKQKGNELFKHFNLKKEIEMYPLNHAFPRVEPTIHAVISIPKRTSETSPYTTQLADWKESNLANELKIAREFTFASGANVNSFLFHHPNNEHSIFTSPNFASCSDNSEKNLVHSFSSSNFNQNNYGLPKMEQVETDYSNEGFLGEKSPIIKVNQQIQFDRMPSEIIKRERDVIAANAFTSGNSCCEVVMRFSNVNEPFCMNMLLDFSRTHLSEDLWSNMMLQLPGGKTWHVECLFNAENQVMLGKGWREFVLDNHVKEGDVCAFEIIRRDHNELKVTIFRSFQK